MTIRDLETIYGHETVTEAIAMMGAGWSTEDTVEDIVNAHKAEGCTDEEAGTILEVMDRLTEILD